VTHARRGREENIVNQRTEILTRMRTVICDQLEVEPDAVKESASIVEDLGADSLAVVELVLALEETFGVTIPDEAADRLRTVGDVVTYVVQHSPAAGSVSAGAP